VSSIDDRLARRLRTLVVARLAAGPPGARQWHGSPQRAQDRRPASHRRRVAAGGMARPRRQPGEPGAPAGWQSVNVAKTRILVPGGANRPARRNGAASGGAG
jgi:hypothetical protein